MEFVGYGECLSRSENGVRWKSVARENLREKILLEEMIR